MSSDAHKIIYTIGHSTYPIETFVELLGEPGIRCLADVRRFPTSRKHPQFKREALQESLSEVGIQYVWLGEPLGGFRSGGYEAYTETEAFRHGLAQLERLGVEQPTAFMCSERLFFRCHRRFIADALRQRGWQVLHIMEAGKLYEHKGGDHEQDNR